MENGKLYWREEEVLETDKLSLKGRHNLENILFIVSTGKLCGIESEKDKRVFISYKDSRA